MLDSGTMSLQRLHLWIGVATLIVFLLTGQYMDRYLRHLVGMEDGPRMLYRSAHIYLLWSGLLNASFGLYPSMSVPGWRNGLRKMGSALVLVAPPLLLIAFFVEPRLSDFWRPYSRSANYLATLGVLMCLIAQRRSWLRQPVETHVGPGPAPTWAREEGTSGVVNHGAAGRRHAE